MKISHVGVDIAKSVFQIHAADRLGKALWRVKLSRSQWIDKLCEKVPATAVIAMESCAGAHHWARVLQARGYTVRLIDARFVKPYVKSNKQECRYLVKDFGTSQSPKSTRQRDSRYCPDRPALITTPSRTLQQSCSCATPS
ncbi:MAG: hypothetical protein C3L25_05725 [Candidatus Sedimenticola endophacoides]|nr:MAG: hypothetical protein C3L25_11685 [Candidatus Sedimenticola endophacoides]PUE02383.1 MAG: hypothetical protein C3L25_10710 [Candidatus Sedimenticola endophacoides]PUE03973.1 MAG: hypothetical protein C3L25_05725 [Candidatus Sedimenticola endophacoides]